MYFIYLCTNVLYQLASALDLNDQCKCKVVYLENADRMLYVIMMCILVITSGHAQCKVRTFR